MSDVMFYGILQMPYEMTMNDPISRFQFYKTAQQALKKIAELEKDLKKYDQLAWDDLSNPKTIWCDCGDGITADSGAKCGICASTPQTKPLSDEEIQKLWKGNVESCGWDNVFIFARAIEERHGIK